MALNRPNSPTPNGGLPGLSKNLALWALLAVFAVFLWNTFNGQRTASPVINYTLFSQQVDAGNVEKVEVVDGASVKGEFRTAVTIEARQEKSFTVLLTGVMSDALLERLERSGVDITAREKRGGIMTLLIAALPWIVIIGIWFFLLRQMQSGGNRAFSFGKSKAKMLTGDTPKVTFADVAGADEAKVELQEIIEFLKDPQKFTRLGGRLPKGALLVGPPGTGKTLLAKAVAGEAGRPFFSMSGSDFVEMFVGVGASRVRDLFEQGKSHAPCIIFIDEIDAVGRHRGAGLGGGHDEREQTLNQLLVEMDGFESNEGVILVAATNRPDVLDPALLRPGRFDRQIVVDPPDVKGREGILRVHTRKIPLAADVRLDTLAKGTPGLTGADLANLVNEAALLAARKNKMLVDSSDFEEAKDKVMLGVERRSLVLTEDERRLTAYHEAGHAIVSMYTPGSDPLHKVTIMPRGRALGLTTWLPEVDRHNYTRDWLEGRLAAAFGGRVAEALVFGVGKVTTGAAGDIQQATGIARRMVTQFGMSDAVGMVAIGDREQEVFLGRDIQSHRVVSERMSDLVDEEVKRLIDEAYQRAEKILIDQRQFLDLMAESLLERETLDLQDLRTLQQGETLPPIEPTPILATPPVVASKPAPGVPSAPGLLGAPPAKPAGA